MDKISGIYKISNKITGDFYIGSSKNIKSRWNDHKSPSRWSRQPGMKLYQDFQKYGLDNFTFEIIEETTSLHEREQYWMDILKPTYNSIRANGWDIERYNRWKEFHRDELLTKCKDYYDSHRDEQLSKKKSWYKLHGSKKRDNYNRLCCYNGETLTLGALTRRFQRQKIPHATIEAKKYLVDQ